MQMVEQMGKTVIGNSYNGIAAVNINGDTLCGLLNYKSSKKSNHENSQKKMKSN